MAYRTTKYVMDYLGISRESLRQLVINGEIEAIKLDAQTDGGSNSALRYSDETIADYIERHTVQPDTTPARTS